MESFHLKDFYTTSFTRHGKMLTSNVYQKRNCIKNLKNFAQEIFPKQCFEFRNYIITDSIVDNIWGDYVLDRLRNAGMNIKKIVIPIKDNRIEDESHKSTKILMDTCDKILKDGISKRAHIISLGGGVINNIAGVVASLLYRGIGLIHIPTTMMAMIDATIDFKQAVNHKYGKNLIGTYYPASTIIIDSNFLETLSNRHILNGLAEGIKHGLTQSEELLDMIVNPLKTNDLSFVRNKNYLDKVCQKVIQLKIPTLTNYHNSDYNEMVPQYGHAIGHAIEHISHKGIRHDSLLHGEALAIGMCISAEISYILKICNQSVVDEHYHIIQNSGLPTFIPETIDIHEIMQKITYDKHYVKKMFTGLVCKLGEIASQNGSYSWEIENEVLEEAVKRNIRNRQ